MSEAGALYVNRDYFNGFAYIKLDRQANRAKDFGCDGMRIQEKSSIMQPMLRLMANSTWSWLLRKGRTGSPTLACSLGDSACLDEACDRKNAQLANRGVHGALVCGHACSGPNF